MAKKNEKDKKKESQNLQILRHDKTYGKEYLDEFKMAYFLVLSKHSLYEHAKTATSHPDITPNSLELA